MPSLTESEHLASLRAACIARIGGSVETHRRFCTCCVRPTFCSECDRDFSDPESIVFSANHQAMVCRDCLDADTERANERAIDRYYGSSVGSQSRAS